MTRNERGFTMVELLVAVVILAVGVLALAGSSGSITGMLTRSRHSTVASQIAAQKLEELRAIAETTRPPCASGQFASSSAPVMRGHVQLTWVVDPPQGGLRRVRAIVRYPVRGGTRTDTLSTKVVCF